MKINEAFRTALESSVTRSFLFKFQKKSCRTWLRIPSMPISVMNKRLEKVPSFTADFIAFQDGTFFSSQKNPQNNPTKPPPPLPSIIPIPLAETHSERTGPWVDS